MGSHKQREIFHYSEEKMFKWFRYAFLKWPAIAQLLLWRNVSFAVEEVIIIENIDHADDK